MIRRLKVVVDVASTTLVIVASVALLWRLYQAPAAPAARPRVEDVSGLRLSANTLTKTRGAGPLVLVEFADYECPFCARHTRNTAPLIKKAFLDSGKIQHVFMNFPLAIHPRAPKAGEAAECAGLQGKFWEMHELLFATPTALETPDFEKRAVELGLDHERFKQCLDKSETAQQVQRDLGEGRRLGVTGTPAFFLGVMTRDGWRGRMIPVC